MWQQRQSLSVFIWFQEWAHLGLESTVPMHPQPRLFNRQLFLDFHEMFFPRMAPQSFLINRIHWLIWPLGAVRLSAPCIPARRDSYEAGLFRCLEVLEYPNPHAYSGLFWYSFDMRVFRKKTLKFLFSIQLCVKQEHFPNTRYPALLKTATHCNALPYTLQHHKTTLSTKFSSNRVQRERINVRRRNRREAVEMEVPHFLHIIFFLAVDGAANGRPARPVCVAVHAVIKPCFRFICLFGCIKCSPKFCGFQFRLKPFNWI